MSRINFRCARPARWWPLVLLAVFCVPCFSLQAAPKYGNSLDWVPADATFYSCALRLREQIEIIANSNAWAKLTNLPSVQMARQFIEMGFNRPGGPGDQIQQFFADPANQQLRDLIADAGSNEFVVFGDNKAVDFIDIAQRTLNASRFGTAKAKKPPDEQSGSTDPEMATARSAFNELDANRDRLSAPGIVIGFKLSDTGRAKDQLARLEKLLQAQFEDVPKLSDRLKHSNIAGVDYLTLELDGTLVPWDEVPWDKLSDEPGHFDKLKTKLQEMKLTVCAGVREDYLLILIGSSTDPLAKLGSGKTLAELPELKPLEKFAQQRLTAISFASKAFMEAMTSPDRQLEQLVQMLREGLSYAQLPEDVNTRIMKDANELVADLKVILPIPGANLAFSFLNDRGIEGYQYDWSKNLELDGSKPLSLLDHLGGNPLLAYVARTKGSPQQYETLRKWVQKGYGYFEEFAVPQFSDKEKQKYGQLKQAVEPLMARIDQATSQNLLPGLADGQAAIVLDAKISSKQWFEKLPQDNRSLPMLEPAIIFGVSSPEQVRKAFSEYHAAADAMVEKVKQIEPGSLPPGFTIPLPEVHDTKAGADYSYRLPKDLGVDSQLAPNAGLGSTVAVLSLAPAHTSALLSDAALNVSRQGPLADRSRPLAAAFYFNWAGLIEAATPWADFVVRKVATDASAAASADSFLTDDVSRPELQPEDDNPSAKMILDQVHTVFDILKALRTVESATYFEDGVMVTHSVTEFRDVP